VVAMYYKDLKIINKIKLWIKYHTQEKKG
jgi:hypothetical protein